MTFLNMKNPLRAKLAAQTTPTYGAWVTLEDPTVTEALVELGVDWICVDMEHGSLDYKDVVAHARAARGSGVAVLTRIPTTTVDSVKRALDLGGQSLAIGRDSEVGGERMDRRMQFGERLEPVGAAGGDGHGGSGIREHERHTMAEARGCAGDERGATGEVEEICRRGDGTDRIGVGHRVLRR